MKKLLISLILLSPLTSLAAIAHVQTLAGGGNCGTATTCPVTFVSNVVANNLLVSACRYAGGGRTVTISDTRVSTWALAREHVQTNDGNGTLDVQYAIAAGSGADTVTCGISGAGVVMRATASEFSGNATASVLDKVNSAEGSSATAASGSVTPTTDGQLLFVASALASGGTFTAGTDFTSATQVPTTVGSQKLATEYYIQPTAGAHDGTMTFSSQAWAAVIATFKAAGGGAVITPVQDSGFFNII